MDEIYSGLKEKVPIWTVSHIGHDIPEEEKLPKLKGNNKVDKFVRISTL